MSITTTAPQANIAELGTTLYRFQGQLADLYPVGIFPEGLRYHNDFEGTIVEGPFAGGRIFGLDQFMVRPDGVGVIIAHEIVEHEGVKVWVDLRGYVVPPEGAPAIPLEALLDPTFVFPDADFRVTGAAMARTDSAEWAHLNRSTVVVEGTANLGTGALDVTARIVER
jgi:hypothetical protein